MQGKMAKLFPQSTLSYESSFARLASHVALADKDLLTKALMIAEKNGLDQQTLAIKREVVRSEALLTDLAKNRVDRTARLREGDLIFQGFSARTARPIRVEVHNGPCNEQSSTWTTIGLQYLPSNPGIFGVSLFRRLKAGECVRAVTSQSGTSAEPEIIGGENTVGSAVSDWGRTRLYGRFGGELFGRGVHKGVQPAGALTVDFSVFPLNLASAKSGQLGLQVYLEGRIESISVTSQPEPPTSTCPIVGSRVDDSRLICTFSGLPKTGRIGEAGIYAPYLPWKRTHYRGSELGIVVAPILKIGTQGRIQNVDQAVPFDFDYKGATYHGTELRSGPYSYRAIGGRVGLVRLFYQDAKQGESNYLLNRTGPILLTHVDFMVGHWQNFSLPQGLPLPLRAEFRGNLDLPNTPFFAGAFVNIGQGPNDYRFFFGMRTEFSQLSTKIRWRHNPAKLFYEPSRSATRGRKTTAEPKPSQVP